MAKKTFNKEGIRTVIRFKNKKIRYMCEICKKDFDRDYIKFIDGQWMCEDCADSY